jgi:hypothetical protein
MNREIDKIKERNSLMADPGALDLGPFPSASFPGTAVGRG